MKTKLSIVLFITLIGMTGQSFAQDAAGLSPGNLSVGVGLIDLGALGNQRGVIGGKYFMTDALNIGIDFGIRIERGDLLNGGDGLDGRRRRDWALLVAPKVQYYFKTGNMVTPFVFGQFQIVAIDTIGDVEPDLSIGFGGGAEYFLYDYFGISGQVGLNLFLAPAFGIGTFNTRLNANFYF